MMTNFCGNYPCVRERNFWEHLTCDSRLILPQLFDNVTYFERYHFFYVLPFQARVMKLNIWLSFEFL